MADTIRPFHQQLPLWPADKAFFKRLQIDEHISRSGGFFRRFQFSRYGIPPGTTREILTSPENFWRKVEKKRKVFYEPLNELREIHVRFARYFAGRTGFLGPATAYWYGSSIIKNGNPHRHSRSSLSLDMRSAFESVKTKHLYRFLCRGEQLQALKDPSILQNQTLLLTRDQAWVLSRLLTYRGRLRQGSPVSPFVFNMLCERLDSVIRKSLGKFPGTIYTRYGDDLSFSSPAEIFPEEVENAIRNALRVNNLVLNENKTRRCSHGILEFPGIVIVKSRVRPRGKYIASVSQRLSEMTKSQREGHRGFLFQFGKGLPRILKKFLVL